MVIEGGHRRGKLWLKKLTALNLTLKFAFLKLPINFTEIPAIFAWKIYTGSFVMEQFPSIINSQKMYRWFVGKMFSCDKYATHNVTSDVLQTLCILGDKQHEHTMCSTDSGVVYFWPSVMSMYTGSFMYLKQVKQHMLPKGPSSIRLFC